MVSGVYANCKPMRGRAATARDYSARLLSGRLSPPVIVNSIRRHPLQWTHVPGDRRGGAGEYSMTVGRRVTADYQPVLPVYLRCRSVLCLPPARSPYDPFVMTQQRIGRSCTMHIAQLHSGVCCQCFGLIRPRSPAAHVLNCPFSVLDLIHLRLPGL